MFILTDTARLKTKEPRYLKKKKRYPKFLFKGAFILDVKQPECDVIVNSRKVAIARKLRERLLNVTYTSGSQPFRNHGLFCVF